LALTVPGSAAVPRSGLRPALLLYAAAPGTITTNPLHRWSATSGTALCWQDQVGGALCAAK
jgi:hypothetical protein